MSGKSGGSSDDANGFYDRYLGAVTNDTASQKPYQLKSATNLPTTSPTSGQLAAKYDDAGNMTALTLARNGVCIGGSCSQRFEYAYDEVGRLIEARRWNSAADPPVGAAAVTLKYAYNANDERVLKTDASASGTSRHTLYIFGSLELRRAAWLPTGPPDYERTAWTEVPYLSANSVRLGRVVWHEGPGGAISMPGVGGTKQHVFLQVADHLGSSSIIIDKATGEVVEQLTYQPYGGTESDYRTDRWKAFREDYRFTGKEEDVEVGLQHFGKRFLNPLLGRWINADPLAVHSPGEADLNLYAYVHGAVLKAVDPLGLDPKAAQDIAAALEQAGNQQGNGGVCGQNYTCAPPSWETSVSNSSNLLNQAQSTPSTPAAPAAPKPPSRLDRVQTGLDAAGFVPGPVGVVADAANTGISLGRGDWVGAGLNSVAMVPLLGDAAKGGKLALESGDEMITLYRGTTNRYEIDVFEETGAVMSDSARAKYLETGSSAEALRASEGEHQRWIELWGGERHYAEAHAEWGTELPSAFGMKRTFTSWTTDANVANRFASDGAGVVFRIRVPRNMVLKQTLQSSNEAEYLLPHGYWQF